MTPKTFASLIVKTLSNYNNSFPEEEKVKEVARLLEIHLHPPVENLSSPLVAAAQRLLEAQANAGFPRRYQSFTVEINPPLKITDVPLFSLTCGTESIVGTSFSACIAELERRILWNTEHRNRGPLQGDYDDEDPE